MPTERGEGGFGHSGKAAKRPRSSRRRAKAGPAKAGRRGAPGMNDAQPIPAREGGGHARGDPSRSPRRPPPEAPEEAQRSRVRLLSAAVLVPAVIYLIRWAGCLSRDGGRDRPARQREFYRLIEDKGAQPLVSYGLVAGAALPVIAYVGNEYQATLLMTATLLA